MGKATSALVLGFLVGVLAATAVFALMIPGLRDSGDRSAETVLKLAHSMNEKHPVHLSMLRMAEVLSEKSDGAVRIEIFTDGQLGDEVACIEQVQRGVLDMTKCSASALEGFVPELAVFGVPFLFRDREHAWSVYDGEVGEELLAAGSGVGLQGLCYYDAGARSFYTIDKPVRTPEDLANLKIRVQESQTSMKMVEYLGGSPTPMNFGELYTGLQQGIVDGAENNPPSFYLKRHFEVCKHYSLNEHTRVPDILLISQSVWDELPEQVQEWIQQSAAESAEHQRFLWDEKTEEALQRVQDEGVTVYRPDREPFAAKVRPMYDSYEGTPVGRLISRIQESP